MTFQELLTEVISLTRRPDRVSDTKRSINQAIRQISITHHFPRDRQELAVSLVEKTETAFSLPLTTFSRFRKFSAIRPSNRLDYVKEASPDSLFYSGVEELDVFYIAGDQVNFKLKQLAPSLLVAWYSYPVVLVADADTNWITELLPYVVIDGAAAKLLASIGDDASANKHEGLFQLGLNTALRDITFGAIHG